MKRLNTTLIALLATTAVIAQNISYGEYMERVFAGNIALTARKLDIEIADAEEIANNPNYDDEASAEDDIINDDI